VQNQLLLYFLVFFKLLTQTGGIETWATAWSWRR